MAKANRTRKRKLADVAVERQANSHRRARKDRAAEIAEDYVELIADLIATKGEARTVDIAARLGVSHVTAVKAIGRLRRDGLVHSEPYRSVFLTDRGEGTARKVRERHELVVRFLRAVGVPRDAAEADAEGIEHHVSDKTLAAFARFVARS